MTNTLLKDTRVVVCTNYAHYQVSCKILTQWQLFSFQRVWGELAL